MSRLALRLCQTCLLIALLGAAVLSSLPYSPLALILLLVMLFITFRPLYPRLNIVIAIATIFLLPLVLEPLLGYLTYTALLSPISLNLRIFTLTLIQIMALIATLPALYLLNYYLRQNAQRMTLSHHIKGRYITHIPIPLFISALIILLASVMVNNPMLFFVSIILIVYLLTILIRVLRAVPRLPLDIPVMQKRIIAGTTADISLHPVSKASIRLHSLLSPIDSWVKIVPHQFTLNGAKTELNLTITPPLAGPLNPQLKASVIDPWGFIQVNQLLQPVELHVIPRARYAEWLAMRYLEQARMGGTVTTTPPPKAALMPKGGTEYSDSRNYQPGDPLVHIDWKHTLKLNQLIIKEFIESGGQVAIIAVNLSVSDAEEADKLAFNLITTALTLARESIPTALTVYNHQKVILTTAVIEPRETLKQSLSLVKDITSVEFATRFLQPPDISKLRRNITQLKQVTSEPAQRLLSILNFEYQAIEESAKNHPATLALSLATRHAPPPAIILLVSQLNHDTEALLVTAEKLSRRGFTAIPVETASSARSGYGEILAGHHELSVR